MTRDRLSVYILTQHFYPEVPGTAQISTDLAFGLTQAGFEVSVFTGQPAYWDPNRLPSKEDHRGVRIHRAYSRRLSRDRLSREGHRTRLLNGATVAAFTLIKLMGRRRPSVVLVDSTSPFLLVVAWLLRQIRRVHYVFLVHDVYPEIAIQLGIIERRSLAARIWRQAYKLVYGSAARIIVLGPRMREVVRPSLAPDSYDKCVVIPNWADGDAIVPRPKEENPFRRELGLVDTMVVLYSGNMGPAHDMETVLEAAERLQNLPDLRFLFIGHGGSRDWVSSAIDQRKLTNVMMLPYQPQVKLPYSLTCGDISLVTQKRGMEGLSVPSKIYSSLAAGLAIIAVVGEGSEIGEIVEEHRCGYRVAQGDVGGLAEAIESLYTDRRLLSDMQLRARSGFEASYTRTMSIGLYVSLLRAVAAGSRPEVGIATDEVQGAE